MHSATIFITELGICRIIPNLNQRVAKNKQKNNNKNKKSGIICAIMIAFVWYASFLSFFSMN